MKGYAFLKFALYGCFDNGLTRQKCKPRTASIPGIRAEVTL